MCCYLETCAHMVDGTLCRHRICLKNVHPFYCYLPTLLVSLTCPRNNKSIWYGLSSMYIIPYQLSITEQLIDVSHTMANMLDHAQQITASPYHTSTRWSSAGSSWGEIMVASNYTRKNGGHLLYTLMSSSLLKACHLLSLPSPCFGVLNWIESLSLSLSLSGQVSLQNC